MRILLYLLLLTPFTVFSQTYELSTVNIGTNTSIRGMSVVSDSVAWVSGNNGFIGKSINGGKEWTWTKPKGYETLDFRDIEAFDKNHAVIVNAGSPAYILRTEDGGKKAGLKLIKTWTLRYSSMECHSGTKNMGSSLVIPFKTICNCSLLMTEGVHGKMYPQG
ncbi:WD40/YVTN/BNR-like repeat-containing protein [Pedobacter sp. NJ-S-72]